MIQLTQNIFLRVQDKNIGVAVYTEIFCPVLSGKQASDMV